MHHVGVPGLRRAGRVKQALRLAVRLDELDLRLVAAREPQVSERHVVDGEDAARGPVLGRHVRDRGAVGERQLGQAVAEELDELADDALLAKHLGDREHEVGRRRSLGQGSGQLHADDLRDQHRHWLPEHRGLGLDAADAPSKDAQTVDHRRVRVGADERVGVQRAPVLALHDDPGQVLEVDLVHDALVRRHDLEVAKRRLPPLEKLVPLLVPLKLELRVDGHRVARAERVDLHGVVDDELHGLERVDLLRVASEHLHGVAHRGEIDHGGDAREVLQEHARRRERDLARGLGRDVHVREAPRCPRGGRRRRPPCEAGSRAGSSARTGAARPSETLRRAPRGGSTSTRRKPAARVDLAAKESGMAEPED